MMTRMKYPAEPAVHHPAVNDISKSLHEGDRGKQQGKTGRERHGGYIRRPGASDKAKVDSLFSGGHTTALTQQIAGLDDFELIAFIAVVDAAGAT